MSIRVFDDLYPADDPRDGTRILRFSHHQQATYEGVRNGVGAGQVTLRGTSSDGQAIAPTGMQYVRKGIINTAIVDAGTLSGYWEKVIGGYFFEEGDFLALDRKTLRTLTFGGASTLSYLDREVMWSHSYAHGIVSGFVPQDPFDGIWRLWNQGDAMGGDKLGAILWRVIKEGQAYRSGATYTHRHATGDEFNVEFTDAHDDDKLETAIPFVTLGFTQSVDSSGNAWTVGSGEFEAQVGESLFEVTKRLMDAGLYVELDPDTFELRAWEVANHGRDRTGLAWGADVVRFEPPPPPSTDRAEGNILNDLKRALKPFIKVTAVLAGGGEDTYAVATASGVVPWHRFRPLDINDTTALSAAATRDITRRNDAGDTVLVRSKVGNDPANGYYLPEEHAKLDDLVTVHSGTDTWDWDEAAYPIAKWSVTSRRTGAPDVFYHLGASYHAGVSKEFAGGAGVGRHTHPPNPRLCAPTLPGSAATRYPGTYTATNPDGTNPGSNLADDDDSTWFGSRPFAGGEFTFNAGSVVEVSSWFAAHNPAEAGQRRATTLLLYANDHATNPDLGTWTLIDTATDACVSTGVRAITPTSARFWRLRNDTTQCASGLSFAWRLAEWHLYSGGTAGENPNAGNSPHAARCDHTHPAEDHEHDGYSPTGHSHLLNGMDDVDADPAPSDGDILVWDDTAELWIPEAPGAGAAALDDLTDVTIVTPGDGQVLTYDSGSGEWVNENSPSGFANPMTTAGDIITGGSGGTASRLALGSALQHLRVNAGATALEYADPPAGESGDGFPTGYHPDRSPGSPSSVDDEFNDSSLHADWSWRGGTTPATVSESAYAGKLHVEWAASVADYQLQRAYVPGAADLTVAAKLHPMIPVGNFSLTVGIVTYDSSDTKIGSVVISPQAADPSFRGTRIIRRNVDSAITTVDHVAGRPFAQPIYIALHRTAAGSWTASFSNDGLAWTPIGGATINTATVAKVGLQVAPSHAYVGRIFVDWIRMFTSVTTKVGSA